MILHYFAYFDGEKLAIAKQLTSLSGKNKSQDNYGIYKVNNSFQFYENQIRNTGGETAIRGEKFDASVYIPSSIIVRIPRQIDLETGEIY